MRALRHMHIYIYVCVCVCTYTPNICTLYCETFLDISVSVSSALRFKKPRGNFFPDCTYRNKYYICLAHTFRLYINSINQIRFTKKKKYNSMTFYKASLYITALSIYLFCLARLRKWTLRCLSS